MDRWIVIPLEKVGKIEFGMNRRKVREILDEEYEEFKKNIYSDNTTDDYGRFHVFYDKDDNVEAVEIFEGIEVIVDNKVVFPLEEEKLEDVIIGIEQDEFGYTSIEKSIGLCIENGKVESILFGVKGYYE